MDNQKRIYAYSVTAMKDIICMSFYHDDTYSTSFVLDKERNDSLAFIHFMKNNVKGLVGFKNLERDQYFLYRMANISSLNLWPEKVVSLVNDTIKEYSVNDKFFKSEWAQLDLTRLLNEKGKDLSSIAYSNQLPISDLDEFQTYDRKDVKDSTMIKAMSIWKLFEMNKGVLKLRGVIKQKTGMDFNSVKEIDIIPKMIRKMLKLKQFDKPPLDGVAVPLADIIIKNGFRTKEFKDLYDYFHGANVTSTKKELSYRMLFHGVVINYATAGFYSEIKPAVHTGRIVHVDVVQFYPTILDNYNIYPKFIGPKFNDAYRDSIKILDGNHKLSLNAVIGKMNKPENPLYDKKAWLKVSINAQLIFSQFIEQLCIVSPNIEILSIKTDGIYFKVASDDEFYDSLDVIADWQDYSGFKLSYQRLDKLVVRDANNVLEIFEGKVISSSGMFKKFKIPIVNDAIVAYFRDGTPIETTINDIGAPLLKYALLHKASGTHKNFISTLDGDSVTEKFVKYIVVKEGGVGLYSKNLSSNSGKRVTNKPVIIANSISSDSTAKSLGILVDYNHYLTAAKSIIEKIETKQAELF